MKIRPATLTDTAAMCAAHKASIATLCAGHYSAEDIKGWLTILSPEIYKSAINSKIVIVAEKNERVVGLGILDPEHNDINALYIHPQVVGMGFGKGMLQELEQKALRNGTDRLALYATLNALDFYAHHGYVRDGKAVHDLPNGVVLECVAMHKDLGLHFTPQ